jgi:hypothetical protein
VQTRGYSEAEVLKHIAQHLLDSKQFVAPQAERADLVVRYEIPEWDAPDSDARVSLVLRRAAAEALRGAAIERFGEAARMEERDGERVIRLDAGLSLESVDAWGRERFPSTFSPDAVGAFWDQEGGSSRLPSLAFTEVLIAALTQRLRRVEEAPPPD